MPRDYRIKISARNNRILERIEEHWPSIKQFADDTGLAYNSVVSLITLRATPTTSHGDWREIVIALATALGTTPDELFSERQKAGHIARSVIRHVDDDDIELLSSSVAALLPDLSQPDLDRVRYLREILENTNLMPRDRKVIMMRYFDGMTLEEVGDEIGCTKDRVRQIEQRALAKMQKYAATAQTMLELRNFGEVIAAPARKAVAAKLITDNPQLDEYWEQRRQETE